MGRKTAMNPTLQGVLAVLVVALFACKDQQKSTGQTGPPETAAAPAPAPTVEESVEDFKGSYVTNWGKAKCTQVKRNVNCLYAGKSGSLDCTVLGERELECEWDEPGASGKAKLVKKTDGRLVGTWGNGSSATNGGAWVFKPTAD